MFAKILIANRGDQTHGGAATQSKCLACAARGDFTAESIHVQ